MSFGEEVASGLVADVGAGMILASIYVGIQWFLAATDIEIGYSWSYGGTPWDDVHSVRPSFDIRNRSHSKTYYLANVAYLKDGKPVAPFDNKSVWGTELKPGSITYVDAGPIISWTSLRAVQGVEVHVRLQNGRSFWMSGTGPGHVRRSRLQRFAFWLRAKIESRAVPME